MRQKYIMHRNIDKTMKIKTTKNLQTSTNTWWQKLLSSFTYSSNDKNTEKCNKHNRTEQWQLRKSTAGGYVVEINW